MAPSLDQNQFALQPIQGMMDLRSTRETIACGLDSTTGGSVLPGQAVKVVDNANGGIPKVVEVAADTDDVFGFVAYDLKSQSFGSGDKLDIATGGEYMYMTASAAIAQGAKVMVVVASKKVATATTGKTIIGRALDHASADGDLIRVKILLPGAAAP